MSDVLAGLLALRQASSATTTPQVRAPVAPAIGSPQELGVLRQVGTVPGRVHQTPESVHEAMRRADYPTGATMGSDAASGVLAAGDVLAATSKVVEPAGRALAALAALPSHNMAQYRKSFEEMRARGDQTLKDGGLDPAASDALFADLQGIVERGMKRVPVSGSASVWDVFDNFGDGYRNFSLLAGGQSDGVEAPVAAAWFAGAAAAVAAEGPVTDIAALSWLQRLAKTSANPGVQKSAARALTLFGQGELQPVWRRIAGNAALGGATTTGLLAVGGTPLDEALTTGALATGAGAVLGAPLAGIAQRQLAGKTAGEIAARVGFDEAQARVMVPHEYLRVGKVEGDEVGELRNLAGFMRAADPQRADMLHRIALKAGKDEPLDAVEQETLRVAREIQARERWNDSRRPGASEDSLTPLTDAAVARAAGENAGVVYRSMFGAGGSAPGAGAPAPVAAAVPDELDRRAALYVQKPKPKTTWETLTDRLRSVKDRLGKSFVFEYDVRAFPSFTGEPTLRHADDINLLNIQRQRNLRVAEEMVRSYLEPLEKFGGKQFAEQFAILEDIVIWRDVVETLEKGIPFGDFTVGEAQEYLARKTAKASLEVLDAASRYKQIVNKIRDELVEDGLLHPASGFDNYFPHKVIDDLAAVDYEITGSPEWVRKRHPSTIKLHGEGLQLPGGPVKREGGDRPIEGDLLGVSFRAFRTHLNQRATRDFLNQSIEAFGQKPGPFVDDMIEEYGEHVAGAIVRDLLGPRKGATLPDGTRVKLFNPTPPAYYEGSVIGDEIAKALVSGGKVADEDVLRALIVGMRREVVMPEELATRYKRFYEKDPLPLNMVRWATGEWTRSTVFYGMMEFVVNNMLGDNINLLRSNPQAFVQLKRGKIDSPALTAIRAIFNHYKMPIASPQQMLGAMAGGFGGLTIDEAIVDDPGALQRIGSVLAGAGLGYAVGSRGLNLFGKQILPDQLGMAKFKPWLETYYETADRMGAINSGYFSVDVQDVPRFVLGSKAAYVPASARGIKQRSLDTAATLLTGKVHGNPWSKVAVASDIWEGFNKERENVLRLASFIQQVESGTPNELAARRASAAMVDYGRLTDFERKYLRGVLAPFYTFTRFNTENWIRAMLGKDVGGKGKIALASMGAIAGIDIAAQQWNDRFFPEVEAALPEKMRKRFHVILGNPGTREVMRDKKGNPMVMGWEMPYEMALEFMGLARPGILISEMFGHDLGPEASLIQRVRDADGFNALTSAMKAPIIGTQRRLMNLLTPFVRVPIELRANERFYYSAPLVPDRYLGTPIQKERARTYIAESFLRQYREASRMVRDAKSDRFNIATSPLVGMPLQSVTDRNLKAALHKEMDAIEQGHRNRLAQPMKQVEDLIYRRPDLMTPLPGEEQTVSELADQLSEPDDQAALLRFYYERTYKTDILRRYLAMPMIDRARFLERVEREPWKETAFWYYINGGNTIFEDGHRARTGIGTDGR